ncbi:hypothetical protein [Actinoplanes sp. DH11]|uniref:hypothetical protein n=1 Tax=Actinoplanes sp. DH11 TaxID=2857011 RepID=UPI001E2C6A86|nr:hypothetical protein [Actinoplanes sp. DH11]
MLGTSLLAAVAVLAAGTAGTTGTTGAGGALGAPGTAGVPGVPAGQVQRGPTTEMVFAVSPDEVRQGSRITLSGKAGWGDTGNAAPVDLYFRKTEKDRWARIGRVAADDAGRFRTTMIARTSGDYEAVYRGIKKNGRGSAYMTDYLAVFTTRTVDRLVYTWQGTQLQCHPVCRAQSPELTLGRGPVHVSFRRDCGRTRSGGSLGFGADPWNRHAAGDPGWRDFPDGAGPTAFTLAPPKPAGHFYLTWSSVQRERGQATVCDLGYTVTQTATEVAYV